MDKALLIPSFLYQKRLGSECRQVEFSPVDGALYLLSGRGEIFFLSPHGDGPRALSLPFRALSFRINPTGSYLVALGDGELASYGLDTGEIRRTATDPKNRLVEFHGRLVALGGFHNRITFLNRFGREQRSMEFEFLIRQFKPVPGTKHIVLYNQDLRLVCAEEGGEVLWETEWMKITDEIAVARGGKNNLFLTEGEGLVQFDCPGGTFLKLGGGEPVERFSLSRNGEVLLTLGPRKTLRLFDKELREVWKKEFPYAPEILQLSPDGTRFAVADAHGVLTCFSTESSSQSRGDFLEVREGVSLREKEATWSLRPGATNPVRGLELLTVNARGNRLGLLGLDGGVHFLDHQGNRVFETGFPARVEEIAIGPQGDFAAIYGEGQLKVADLAAEKTFFLVLEGTLGGGRPMVNFHHRKAVRLSGRRELQIMDFVEREVRLLPLPKNYQQGLSLEERGFVLYNTEELAVYSAEGKKTFSHKVKGGIHRLRGGDGYLLALAGEGALLRVDLATRRGRRKKIASGGDPLHVLSMDPLLLMDEERRLYLLDDRLAVVGRGTARERDSFFFVEGERPHEVLRREREFLCYDPEGRVVWRYQSGEHMGEKVGTSSGIAFICGETLNYIAFQEIGEARKDFSHFLEI